ncbi:type IV pilus assembly protein PilO [Halanaerobium saccharolyticum]|uniref:Type IV pilus assembly protein PilO n=1 Tax=Halanaerobium saccharolyticum TaxID=43595 RepID=A0A2T5RJY4_9FIRM|nr:type II secretion system protein GspM [Halanaerobium saccharolyticum]PTV99093.1 type IV pilus assembly protein PilO [Halanaerobium saccharolyticum]
MSNLSKREKVLLFILFVTVVFVAYYYLLYQPIQAEQQNLENQIANTQSEYTTVLSRVNQIEDLKKELANLQRERQERLEIVIREAEEILAAIDFFARESDVEIRSYQKGNANNGYPFTFNIEGEYFELLSFLRMLDNWDYRLVVENLSANNIQQEDNLMSLTLNLFYHQSDELRDFIERSAG